jgi:hypothetical protein
LDKNWFRSGINEFLKSKYIILCLQIYSFILDEFFSPGVYPNLCNNES